MIKKFLSIFKVKLAEALSKKTSWGRNDLTLLIEEVISETLLDLYHDSE
jgi:hypothetical protein